MQLHSTHKKDYIKKLITQKKLLKEIESPQCPTTTTKLIQGVYVMPS